MKENENTIENVNSDSHVIDDAAKLSFLIFKHKWFIIIFVFVITAASVVYTLLQKNQYVATVSVVPPKTTSNLMEGALGNISSALKDFGLSKIGGQSMESYSFMVVFESRSVIDSMIKRFDLPKRYDIPDSQMHFVRLEFLDRFEVTSEKMGNYTVSVWDEDPVMAAKMANNFVEIINEKAIDIFKTEATMNRKYIEKRLKVTDSLLAVIGDSLGKYSKDKMLISPEDQAKSISTAYSELKAKSIESEVMFEIFKNTYGINDPLTKFQENMLSELKNELNKAENIPGFAGNFSMKDATGVGIEYMRLYAEYETFTTVKAILMPMLEKARLDEARSSNSLIVMDEAIPPQKKDRPKRSVIVLGSAFGAFVLAIIILLSINNYRILRNNYKKFAQKQQLHD